MWPFTGAPGAVEEKRRATHMLGMTMLPDAPVPKQRTSLRALRLTTPAGAAPASTEAPASDAPPSAVVGVALVPAPSSVTSATMTRIPRSSVTGVQLTFTLSFVVSAIAPPDEDPSIAGAID